MIPQTWTSQLVPRVSLGAVRLGKDSDKKEERGAEYEIVTGNGPDRLGFANSLFDRREIRFLIALPGGYLSIAHLVVDEAVIEDVREKIYFFRAHQAPLSADKGKEMVAIEGTYSPTRRMGKVQLYRAFPPNVGDYIRENGSAEGNGGGEHHS